MVFLNAFVDLGHKIVIQNTVFKVWDGDTQVILTAIINACILLPFVALFSQAGFLSDRFAKHRIIQYSAAIAVLITLGITVAYALGWFTVAFVLTLALSAQSAVYAPAKLGYLRESIADAQLVRGNAVMQTVTIIAILSSTFAFSVLFEWLMPARFSVPSHILPHMTPLGLLLVALAVCEWCLARQLTATQSKSVSNPWRWRYWLQGQYFRSNIRAMVAQKSVWLAIVGLALFWSIAQVIAATFPAYAKAALAIENTVLIHGLLACSGIGIAMGALMSGHLSRHVADISTVPFGALGMMLVLACLPYAGDAGAIALLFIGLGLFGGLFIVPLYALLQYRARASQLGRVLAGSQWLQNITMLAFLLLIAWLSTLGLISSHVWFWVIACVALIGGLVITVGLPESLLPLVILLRLRRAYRVQVEGLEYLPKKGGVLLVTNENSTIDRLVIRRVLPQSVTVVHAIQHLQPGLFEFLKQGKVYVLLTSNACADSEQCMSDIYAHLDETKTQVIPFFIQVTRMQLFKRKASGHATDENRFIAKVRVVFKKPRSLDTV